MHELVCRFFAITALGVALASGPSCSSAERDARIPFTPVNDVQFIDGMVPHHEMAVQMADQVLERGSSAAVRAMAQRMKDAQSAEIAQMTRVRAELTGSDVVPEPRDPQAHAKMTEMMALSGDAFDQRFLSDMRPHHGGAMLMSDRALPNLQRADMGALAEKIISDQAREIGEIQRMLEGS